MKNLSLGVKLIGGFGLTAIIIIFAGLFSISQQNKLAKATTALGEDALVAVESILALKDDSAEVVIQVRSLLSPYISTEERGNILQKIRPLRENIAELKKKFTELSFFTTVQPEWEEYNANLDKWIKANNRAIALSNEIAFADIANPEQLVKDMQKIEIAHKSLLNSVDRLVFLGVDFAGGTDSENCALGRWLANMPTTNPEIVAEMKELRPIHRQLHLQVAKIKELMAAGQTGRAQSLLENRLLPLSEQIFAITEKVSGVSEKYHGRFDEFSKILLSEVNKYQHDTFAVMDQIVEKARSYAQQSTKAAEATAARGRTVSIICMVAGTILALLLGFIFTTMITRPLSKGVELAKSMAAGDMTKTLDIDQRDEIGILGKSLNNMATQLRHTLTNVNREVD